MQLIDLNLQQRRILSPSQTARVVAAIAEGRLVIDLEESMDFAGDLVVEEAVYRKCLEIAGS